MPTKRKKVSRNRQYKCPRRTWHVLIDDPLQPGDPDYNSFQNFLQPREWETHRDEVLDYWTRKHPGTRPKTWWRLEGGAYGHRECYPPQNQRAFLKKHNLLTPIELEVLQ